MTLPYSKKKNLVVGRQDTITTQELLKRNQEGNIEGHGQARYKQKTPQSQLNIPQQQQRQTKNGQKSSDMTPNKVNRDTIFGNPLLNIESPLLNRYR